MLIPTIVVANIDRYINTIQIARDLKSNPTIENVIVYIQKYATIASDGLNIFKVMGDK